MPSYIGIPVPYNGRTRTIYMLFLHPVHIDKFTTMRKRVNVFCGTSRKHSIRYRCLTNDGQQA